MESIEVKGKRSKEKGFLSTFRSFGLLLLLLTASATATKAQTFDEWWHQKSTQIKYLTQQIAALQVYGNYLKQGYQISQNGLGTINGWTKGEFNLHADYYSSLKTVNPEIKDNPKAAAIVQYAGIIPGQFDHLNSLDGLTIDNRRYIATVQNKVLTECDADIAELQLIMTSGKAEMTDDERIKRLDQVYSRIKDKYAFTLSFCNQVKTLLLQKTQYEQSIQTLRRLYGINE